MKWWRRPIEFTIILVVLVIVLDVFMALQISNHPASGPGTLTEEQRYGKLGQINGIIFGAGSSLIWLVAYLNRNRQNPNFS